MHALVNSTFKSEIHRPSADHVWHTPLSTDLPKPLPFAVRDDPLLLQDTSYFAASASISSFLKISILHQAGEQKFAFSKYN
jgi:hypothetical protein